ncbi:MAG: molybdenum cofactor guanylyltransferase [Caldilineaceae bacterium]|nr:molybdenum cofactor guanylyltransferase [Caldilineaceae bacterium]
MNTACTLVVNAGGQSRRMGEPKALLSVPPTNEPLLATIIRRLRGVAPEPVLVIANDPQIRAMVQLDEAVSWLRDRYVDVGPLGGIATALAAVDGWAIVVACDMPLLNPELLRHLRSIADEVDAAGADCWDAVVPVVNGFPEPLHALYHARALAAVEARLAAGQRRATAFLSDVRVRYVSEAEMRPHDPALHSFLNVNTPAEWAHVRQLLS